MSSETLLRGVGIFRMPQVRSCAVPSAVLGTQPSTWVEVFQHGVFEPEDQEEKSFGWTN